MALYLWDANWRNLIKFMQTADLKDLTDLQECAKLLVLAKRDTLGLKGKLEDKVYLTKLLQDEGLID